MFEHAQLIEELEVLRKRVLELEQASSSESEKDHDLSREEKLFLAIVKQAPFTVWASQCSVGDYEVVLWNRGAEEIYGYSKEEAIGRNYLDLFVSDEERVQSAVDCDAVLDGKVFRNFLAYDEAKDGTRKAVLTNCFRIWDEESDCYLQAEMAVEVPELARVIGEHQAIREEGVKRLAQVGAWIDLLQRLGNIAVTINSSISENKELPWMLMQIASSVNELISGSIENLQEKDVSSIICVYGTGLEEQVCVLDTNGLVSITSYNESGKAYLGSYVTETGKALFIDNNHDFSKDMHEVLELELNRVNYSMAALPIIFGDRVLGVFFVDLKKPHVFSVEIELALKRFAEQIAMAIHMFTERQELNRLIAERQEIDTRSIIAIDFVHRINNLAGTIPSWVDMIRELLSPFESLDGRIYKYLDNIQRDVMELIREAGKLQAPPELEDVDINLLLEGMLNRVRIMYSEISIESNIDEVNLYPVRATRSQLSNAIWNVINNALEAMSDHGGTLSLEISNISVDGDNRIRISIGDTGVGIPGDQMHKIYSLGYSTKAGTNRGYGLWQTKRVVDELNGSISVESEGTGAKFIIILPSSLPG